MKVNFRLLTILVILATLVLVIIVANNWGDFVEGLKDGLNGTSHTIE